MEASGCFCSERSDWSLDAGTRAQAGSGQAETNWAASEGQCQQHEPLPRQQTLLIYAEGLGGSEIVDSPPQGSSPFSSHSASFCFNAPHSHQSATIFAKASRTSLFQLLSLHFSLVYFYPPFFLQISISASLTDIR